MTQPIFSCTKMGKLINSYGKSFQGLEPAFNTKIVLGLPYNAELPSGYDCENKTATNFNEELGVDVFFYFFIYWYI